MAISTIDQLVDAMGNSSQAIVINKASIANQVAGGFTSLWRATGTPAQGAIPGAAAVCTKALTGAIAFNNPTGGDSSYIGRLNALCSNATTDIQIHDRLAHMGGLSGTVTTAQTVSVDVSGATNNLPARIGATNYSNVQWWLELYTDIGTTGVTATVTYTDADGNTGQTTTVTIGGASPANRASRMFPIFGSGGEFIRSIQTIQHATTGTAGSYGITATRAYTTLSTGLANAPTVADWQLLGLPKVEDEACLMIVLVAGSTSSGTLLGNGKLIQG